MASLFRGDANERNRGRMRSWKQKSAAFIRWLHLYLSLISFGLVFFFSLTGLTLNHPTWFGGNQEVVHERLGQLEGEWLPKFRQGESVKFELVEYLRSNEHVRGAAKEFTVDDDQCMVGFRAPSYSADVFIDRSTGSYQLVESSFGWMALLNDLHKGRDSGPGWSWVIDISAVFLILVSCTGLMLLCFIKRRRFPGIVTTVMGSLAAVGLYWMLVPR